MENTNNQPNLSMNGKHWTREEDDLFLDYVRKMNQHSNDEITDTIIGLGVVKRSRPAIYAHVCYLRRLLNNGDLPRTFK
ncbi:hypothetical protein GJ688_01960 [Heliobacillus mobilis]|uniref:Myb-like domain-containing protein n=1 Tax=Heliobacterium mobile TaxID=28064 RepID=A0A6I3SBD8_HELMO|nr:hypothetical protein [Heliobacterium mobile]MTV47747.1 hypothetical protein [Heliobacterium mobile]